MTSDAARVLIDERVPEDGPLLLDQHDVAELLDTTPETVRSLAASGRLPAPIYLTRKQVKFPRGATREALLLMLTTEADGVVVG